MVEKFIEIFQGLDIAYGEYYLEGDKDQKTGKEKGRAVTKRAPLTQELFQKHLNGEINLGVIPIRQDNTCIWGCIDVDKYDINIKVLIETIRKKKYPLVPYRSKSGGVHLFLHIDGYVSASDMIDKLAEIASVLGLGDCEIFPKQRTINVELGTIGNWLNLPYYNSEFTTRHAINDTGHSIPIEQLEAEVKPFLIKPEGIEL